MRVTNTTSRILSLAAIALAGCATGHDGDVNIGSGQSPDPVVLDIPVAYVRGPLPEDLTGLDDIDARERETFVPGADVWLRDRAAPDVPERNITARVTGGLWDVRDIEGSYDGTKIVYRAHHPQSAEELADYRALLADALVRPTRMELWIMNADGSEKRQLTSNGAANFAPYFTPDGRRVVFASNMNDPRGRNFDLYLIDVDGSNLRQITFHPDFDAFPMFSSDGSTLVWASNRHGRREGDTNVFVAEWVGPR